MEESELAELQLPVLTSFSRKKWSDGRINSENLSIGTLSYTFAFYFFYLDPIEHSKKRVMMTRHIV